MLMMVGEEGGEGGGLLLDCLAYINFVFMRVEVVEGAGGS